MAAPATTARSTPAGIKMDDGFSTKIAFAADPNVEFWEKTVKPPGIDGGDAIETTNMHNVTWRTMAARALKTLTESSLTVFWDPQCYVSVLALVNVEGSITAHFPDGSKLDFYGLLRTFEPNDHTEGEPPEATISITPTNFDPVARTEQGPVLTSVAGT